MRSPFKDYTDLLCQVGVVDDQQVAEIYEGIYALMREEISDDIKMIALEEDRISMMPWYKRWLRMLVP